jgi:hypothetical protein
MNHYLQRTEFMNVSRIGGWCIVAALLAISIAVGLNKAVALQRGPAEGSEVLTSRNEGTIPVPIER